MPREMPSVSLDRRDRADALPTASPIPAVPIPAASAQAAAPLSSGESALIDHVRVHGGRAEVICIVRPHGAAETSSEVFVLPGSSREFVDRLARAHESAATDGVGTSGVTARR
jgi:hypothetical protein